jgi:hypothetical protein
MIERIESLIVETEKFYASNLDPMTLVILKELNRLLMLFKSGESDQHILHRAAYGLATVVMDDYRFSESPLGHKLMVLSNDIIKENK